jgi:hypothetical protein
MAALVAATHAFLGGKKDVDGRNKSGHDGGDVVALGNRTLVWSISGAGASDSFGWDARFQYRLLYCLPDRLSPHELAMAGPAV